MEMLTINHLRRMRLLELQNEEKEREIRKAEELRDFERKNPGAVARTYNTERSGSVFEYAGVRNL